MRKLNPFQHSILSVIANIHGGSYCPPDSASPDVLKAFGDLVKAKRLRIEETDAGPRYHLTGQGAVDAQA